MGRKYRYARRAFFMSYWLERRLPYAFLMAARVISSGRPRCPGCNGRRGLAILNQELGSQWKRFEIICWSWRSDSQACEHLATAVWPEVNAGWQGPWLGVRAD